MIMPLNNLLQTLAYLCSILSVTTAIGIDMGMCKEGKEDCSCGGPNGYSFLLPVKHCTYFYRWKPYCKACDEISKSVRCSPYALCMECDSKVDKCVRCPPNRYGRWCTMECSCQNGGTCDQDTGECTCTPQFKGRTCESTSVCPVLTVPSGVKYEPHSIDNAIGSTVKFFCDAGHVLNGPEILQCTEDGVWSGASPTCRRVCPLVTTPAHGSISLPGGRLTEGVTLTYHCQADYRLAGNAQRFCQKNGQWSGNEPICEKKIVCSQPETVKDGNLYIRRHDSEADLSPGTIITYACNENYALVGQSEILCRADGTWSGETPFCAPKGKVCLHPGPLNDGVIRPHDVKDQETFLQGTEIEFFCNPLHYLLGNSSAVCEENGTWSIPKPSCHKLTTCTAVEHVANGNLEIHLPNAMVIKDNSGKFSRSSFKPGPSVRYRTSNDEEEKAKYSTELPEGHYHVGTQFVFACESRYYDLVGSRVRTCMTNGVWSGRQPTCIPVCGRSSGPRAPFITHGTVSEMGQWPWQVAIARRLAPDDPLGDWWLICGGALISERWVATAAHCVTYSYSTDTVPREEFRLYLGKHYRNSSKDDDNVQVRQIDEIHVHADYEPTTFESDLALIRLSEPVKFTSRVQAVCLPSEDSEESTARLKEGNVGVITGWGKTEFGNFSDVLLDAQVRVINSEQCEEDYKEAGVPIIVTNNMFCAGHNEGVYDSCGGDSGGPLVFPADERKDRWILEGIVSWGSPYGCGNARQHGGYVRVQRFLSWIHQFI